MTKFAQLNLSEKTLHAVEEAGYTTPTPIQQKAIPEILQRKDVMGIAQTGTGKTGAFVLPMLTLLEKGRARARMPRSIVLEPTRELAAQVEETFVKLGAYHKLNIALLIGGTSFEKQEQKLTRGADVLIATPGRLLDHLEKGKLLLTGVEVLVLDEADRMLDMGFIPDIERICKALPFGRQTLFFSATMAPEIEQLTKKFLNFPVVVEVSSRSSTASTITEKLIHTSEKALQKRKALVKVIAQQGEDLTNAIVFCNRKSEISGLCSTLNKEGLNAGALHGDMDQHNRMQTLSQFKTGDIKILVASDVAARGLDIPEVSHVFNYNVPTHSEDYVHRIGRTGRAGKRGKAFTFVSKEELPFLEAIEKLINRKISVVEAAAGFPKAKLESAPMELSSLGKEKKKKQQKPTDKNNKINKNSSSAASHKALARKPQANAPLKEPSKGFGKNIPAFMLIKVKR